MRTREVDKPKGQRFSSRNGAHWCALWVTGRLGKPRFAEPSGIGGLLQVLKSQRGQLGLSRPLMRTEELAGELLGYVIGENREVLRLLAILCFRKSFRSHAALEQLPDCRCPARHPLCKTPRINEPQFCGREHDLEPFASIEFTHLTLPVKNLHSLLKRKKPKISSLLFILINLIFGFWQLER
jgi:hypothetical protein